MERWVRTNAAAAGAAELAVLDVQEMRILRVPVSAEPADRMRADIVVIGAGLGGLAAAMAVGETSGQTADAGPRKVVSSAARPRTEAPPAETEPLIKDADPELEKLLDEEEAIAKRTAQGEGHDTPRLRGED